MNRSPRKLKSQLRYLIGKTSALTSVMNLTVFSKFKGSVLFSLSQAGILAIIAYLFFMQLPKLNSSYSVDQFFPKNHHLLMQNAEIRNKFRLGLKSPIFVVLSDRDFSVQSKLGNPWLQQNRMVFLNQFVDEMHQIENTQAVYSLSSLEGVGETEDSLSVGPLFDEKNVSMWDKIVRSNYFAQTQFLSPNQASTLVIIEPKQLSPKELSVLIGKINSTTDRLIAQHKNIGNIQYSLGGAPVLQSQFAEKLNKDLKQFSLIGFILFVLVFVLLFKGLSALLLTVFSLLIAEVVVLGAMALMSIPFSVLMSSLPIVLSIAMISVHIHTLHRWAEVWPHLDANAGLIMRWKKSWQVIREMLLPNFLGSLTTALGFVTLYEMNSPLIQQYGLAVAIAVMFGFLISQWTLSVLMVWSKPKLRKWFHQKSLWSLPLLKRSSFLVVSIMAVAVFMALMGQKLQYSSRLFDDLPEKDHARLTTDYIDKNFGGVEPYELVLQSQDGKYWSQVQSLIRLQDFLRHVRQDAAVGTAISVSDFIPSHILRKQSQAALDEMVFFYSMSEKNPLQNYLSQDGSLRVAIRFHDRPTDEINNSRAAIKSLAQHYFSKAKIEEGGLAVVAHALNQEISKDLVVGFWHSILLIGFVLLFVFRSLRWAIVACLPNLIPPAVLLGLLVILKTPLKPGVAIVFSIALGLAFNNTVYLLNRLRQKMKSGGHTFLPIKQMLLQEGNPCLFESLVMVFGFVVFLTSQFQMTKIFGFYMLVSIIAGSIGDIVFMPTMLKLFPELLTWRMQNVFPRFSGFQFTLQSKLKVAGFAVVILIVGVAWAAHARADERAVQIFKNVGNNYQFKDQQSDIELKIIEADGEIKSRKVQLKALKDKKYFVTGKILEPSDVKGTKFLSEVDGKEQKQWVYLPSSKQVRRVVGGANQMGFLGSELKAEDLNPTDLKKIDWGSESAKEQWQKNLTIVKEDPHWLKIQFKKTIDAKTKANFDLVQFTIATKEAVRPEVLLRSDYYLQGKLQKTVSFEQYQKIGNNWLPQFIRIENRIKNRKTEVRFSNAKTNIGLRPLDFSVQSLK